MTAGTTSIRAQSHSLTPLAQLLSLCQRYRLPLSLLAIQLKDVASLSKQLGGDRLQRLQKQLGQAVQQRTRMEDALIAWQRGYLVLCLPGTRAAGAANGHASPQQLKDLVDQLRDDDTTLVSTLSPALQRLDERTRMLLIDQLLEASLIPH